MNTDEIKNMFCTDDPNRINIARLQHVKTMKLEFSNKNVLETGCGGNGEFTKFLVWSGSNVTLNDARIDNIKHLISINPGLKISGYNTWDLNNFEDESKFDIIFSYGTLYHLHDPSNALEKLSKMCKDFILLETVVNCDKDISIRYVNEVASSNQSFTHAGCRPSRSWVLNELKKHFKYVYISKYQPIYEDFKLDWNIGHSGNCRSVFIGSHIQLDSVDVWSDEILDVQRSMILN